MDTWSGWRHQSGWRQHSGWSGWRPASASDGIDAAEALLHNAEVAVADRAGATAVAVLGGALPDGRRFPGLETTKHQPVVTRWAADVQVDLALFELSSRLSFEPPAAGKLCRLWHVDPATVTQKPGGGGFERATSPALPLLEMTRPTIDVFAAQVPLVVNYLRPAQDNLSSRRSGRAAEILTQVTPPWEFWESALHLDFAKLPATFNLLNVVMGLASQVSQRFKHAFGCLRPSDYSALVQPMIQVPGHSTLPMGHAAEAYAVATALDMLLPRSADTAALLYRLAARIAENRVAAGVHFPIDAPAGHVLGRTIACYVAQSAGRRHPAVAENSYFMGIFDGAKAVVDKALTYADSAVTPVDKPVEQDQIWTLATKLGQIPEGRIVKALWNAAEDELQRAGRRPPWA